MAYSLYTAHLRKRVVGATLEEVSIGNMLIRNLFRDYVTGYILLDSPALLHRQRLDLQVLQKSKLNFNNLSFSQWLTSIGSVTLPTTDFTTEELPNEGNTVGHIDAHAMGLDIQIVHDTLHPDIEVASHLKTSLYMRSEQENLGAKGSKFLTCVNGYLHHKEILDQGIRIVEGRRTINKSGFQDVSLLSFLNVGDVTEVTLNDNSILADVTVPMHRSVIIELNQSLHDKSVMFSLCGVLQNSRVVRIIDRDNGIVKLDLFQLDLVMLVQMAGVHLDLSRLDLNLPDPFDLNVLKSRLTLERVIRALLTIPQSFAVIVDTPSIEWRYDYPLKTGLYGRYDDSRNLKWPLVDGQGRIVPYRKFREGDIYAYCVAHDHHQFTADQRALTTDVTQVDARGWWGDEKRAWLRFLKIQKL